MPLARTSRSSNDCGITYRIFGRSPVPTTTQRRRHAPGSSASKPTFADSHCNGGKGSIEHVEYEVFAEPLRARMTDAKARRAVERRPDLRTMVTSPADLRRRWDGLSPIQKRKALSVFVEQVTRHARPAVVRQVRPLPHRGRLALVRQTTFAAWIRYRSHQFGATYSPTALTEPLRVPDHHQPPCDQGSMAPSRR
jgi:hypothetical protein